MSQNSVILGYLGRALSYEFSAVQQYLSLSSLLAIRGLHEASEQFRGEAQEELQHAEKIIARMIALGVAPNGSQLRAAKLNGSLSQLVEHVMALESEIIDFYSHAVQYCIEVDDYENRMFFDALLSEEKQHASNMKIWWQKMAMS